METIIGFAAGYLAGAKEGKAGLERLKTSAQAIVKSPETRKLATEALSLATLLVRRTSKATASAVTGQLIHRISDKPRS